MEEKETENVMSVELAVQRELAYRHKLARLGLRSDNFGQDLLQIPSSSYQAKALDPTSKPMPSKNQFQSSLPIHKPIQVQSLSSNPMPSQNQFQSSFPIPKPIQVQSLSSNPMPSQNQFQSSFPIHKPIQVQSLSSNPTSSLCGTKRKVFINNVKFQHHQKPRSFPHQPSYITSNPEAHLYCNICKVQCSSRLTFKQHLRGRQHMNKVQVHEWAKKGASGFVCDLCGISCTDEDCLEMHNKGQKHLSKVRELELGGERKNHRTCQVCNVVCMNEDALQQHFRGKNHLARVARR